MLEGILTGVIIYLLWDKFNKSPKPKTDVESRIEKVQLEKSLEIADQVKQTIPKLTEKLFEGLDQGKVIVVPEMIYHDDLAKSLVVNLRALGYRVFLRQDYYRKDMCQIVFNYKMSKLKYRINSLFFMDYANAFK